MGGPKRGGHKRTGEAVKKWSFIQFKMPNVKQARVLLHLTATDPDSFNLMDENDVCTVLKNRPLSWR